jgi:hypothetical protein
LIPHLRFNHFPKEKHERKKKEGFFQSTLYLPFTAGSPILTVVYQMKMSVPGSLIRTHSNSNMGIKDTRTRRRSRSTSIIHEVLPETVIDESDQSALPNWNSSWVNFKGKSFLNPPSDTRIR